VADFSRLWAQELGRLRREEDAVLAQKRGSLRKLWAEQNLIYADLIGALERAAQEAVAQDFVSLGQTAAHFRDLLDEFADSIQDVNDWHESEHPRCLSCSWDGQASRCPHCSLTLLAPVRQAHASPAPLTLTPHHQAIFDSVVAVLAGSEDIDSLVQPLEALQADFYEAAVDARVSAETHPEMEVVAEILEAAFGGLSQMTQTFEDADSQHLEDGWNVFFLSQLALADALSQGHSDQMRYSDLRFQ